MKIKLYQGKTRRDALQKVKTDLGRDAVILHTKNVPQRGLMGLLGKQVIEIAATTMPQPNRRGRPVDEVPAEESFHRRKDQLLDILKRQDASRAYGATPRRRTVVEELPEPATPAARLDLSIDKPARVRSRQDDLPAAELRREIAAIKSMVDRLVRQNQGGPGTALAAGLPEALRTYHARLVASGFSDDGARRLVLRAGDSLTGQQLADEAAIGQAVCRELTDLARVAGPLGRCDGGPHVVWLVGPTGVGKTTTIAKLAAQYKLTHGMSVGLVTNDTYRIAAVDQLRRYARIMSVPLEVALSPGELREAVERMVDCELVLVDTAGRSHRDVMKMNELTDFMSVCPSHEVHLVLNAAATAAQLQKVVERFRPCGVNRVMFSKIDEAEQYGHLLELLGSTGFAVSYLTTGQDVPDDIEVARSESLVELVLDGGRGDG